ncbi:MULTISPECIES: segregation/condensation protein A [Acidithrix]|uniref:Segregation and condensation protein A n=1 Tax=Acidithrix ferrooxidans TaxID=1280514 RepID=A0A0D8HGJ3_9ACTN|nr:MULTISPECIES: segregation/condensation protein A [Acidithrix]KJF17115.1 segregation and condensation protein A [Acidithrix ferrooxidans]CAG4915303.1 unnamed protein product [Acidithrix sp. C25]
MSFEVKMDIYEGPIGLLLSLIQGQDLDVYQLSISKLVSDYLVEIERRKAIDLEVATEFLLVAATLLEIKCRRLFPNLTALDDEEEIAFFEERDLLLARLLECKTYRDVSLVIASLLEVGGRRRSRDAGFGIELSHLVADPLGKVSPDKLALVYREVVSRQPKESLGPIHVTPLPKVSVAQARDKILARLTLKKEVPFDELIEFSSHRIEIVVMFLGLLELFKLGKIEISQEGSSSPILLSARLLV